MRRCVFYACLLRLRVCTRVCVLCVVCVREKRLKVDGRPPREISISIIESADRGHPAVRNAYLRGYSLFSAAFRLITTRRNAAPDQGTSILRRDTRRAYGYV